MNSINESLCEISAVHIEEQSALLNIINRLDSIEDLAKKDLSRNDTEKVPKMIEKISKLEWNYHSFKTGKEGSMKQFDEEVSQVNYKIQDLKECNNILKELVFCLHKEPVYLTKHVQNAETSMDLGNTERVETISMAKIVDSQGILGELQAKKAQLVEEKEKMEHEYKSIPADSKSMANKRRKQALELELSMNYSKLMSVTNKIKKYKSN